MTLHLISALRSLASRRGARRAAFLADCVGLVEDGVIRPQPDGWGALCGRRGGRLITLGLCCEALAWRRLPQLWLSTTARCDLPLNAMLDVVRRPGAAEFYAHADALADRLPAPASWPQDALVKTSGADAAALLALVEAPLAEMFRDPRVKEVLITRKGARIVRQLREGSKGAYMLFRQSLIDLSPLGAPDVAPAIEAVERLADLLADGASSADLDGRRAHALAS